MEQPGVQVCGFQETTVSGELQVLNEQESLTSFSSEERHLREGWKTRVFVSFGRSFLVAKVTSLVGERGGQQHKILPQNG